MRILIRSNAPWVPSGYGNQCATWALRFRQEGHDVAVSTFYGLQGASFLWNDIPVFPGEHYSDDGLVGDYKFWKADVMITLLDIYVMIPGLLEPLNTYCWFPVDTKPLSLQDQQFLKQSKATPIAMSKYGVRALEEAKFEPLYAPHGIDTDIFKPVSPAERAKVRELGEISPETFVIGIAAANSSPQDRKAFSEQFQAFKIFHDKHPDSLLFAHTLNNDEYVGNGLDLRVMAHRYGINEWIRFSDQYGISSGRITPQMLARWYAHLDLLSNASKSEGFGLTPLEAQACGTPVVITKAGAMPEVFGAGWKVGGQMFWNENHKANWISPSVPQIAQAYERAFEQRGDEKVKGDQGLSAKAVRFAQRYTIDNVYANHWKPILEQMEERL
jgi:glycosyltransferase involved in cell wall biosynthesis